MALPCPYSLEFSARTKRFGIRTLKVINASRGIDGSGHAYWVDQKAGFTTQEQTDLIQFLLSLDDNPAILS
jgi:hypothetical protein